ncbi:MAG: tetratricopeptide repeat protein [Caldilineaceae bacterium]|nr:tetratricopeptide repeat protein [Caldilineaceae bacterium]
MYLDRTYKPRRRRSFGWLWWLVVIGFFGYYLYVRQPDWLVQQPLQPTPTPTRSAVSWLAEAELHLARGEFPLAIQSYQQIARLEPDNADPWVAQGQLYLMDRRLSQATELARRAVEVDPEDVDALALYARVLDWNGDYETAINFAFDALDLQPDHAATLAVLGEIYSSVGNWSRSQEYLDQALTVDPENILAIRNQAILYELQGDYSLAVDQFNRALAIDPDRFDLYIERARQYRALDEWDLAIESYKAAVEVMETPVTLDALGWGLYLSNDTLQALRELRKAVELDPEYGPAVTHLGMAYYARRNYEEAAPTLEKGIALLDENEVRIEYLYSLGLAHIYKVPRECDKAVVWLQKALEIHAESLPALEGMRICTQG